MNVQTSSRHLLRHCCIDKGLCPNDFCLWLHQKTRLKSQAVSTMCGRCQVTVERGSCSVCEPPSVSPFGHTRVLWVSCQVCQDVQGDIMTERQLMLVRLFTVSVVEWSCRVKFTRIIPHTASAALHGPESRSEDAVQSVLCSCRSHAGLGCLCCRMVSSSVLLIISSISLASSSMLVEVCSGLGYPHDPCFDGLAPNCFPKIERRSDHALIAWVFHCVRVRRCGATAAWTGVG